MRPKRATRPLDLSDRAVTVLDVISIGADGELIDRFAGG
jgi:hypothetical protein